MSIGPEDIVTAGDTTPEHAAACRELGDTVGYYNDGPYTPIRYRQEGTPPSLVFPGTGGGVNWNGTAYDPELGYIFGQVEGRGHQRLNVDETIPVAMTALALIRSPPPSWSRCRVKPGERAAPARRRAAVADRAADQGTARLQPAGTFSIVGAMATRDRAGAERGRSGILPVHMADDAQFLSDLPPRRWSPPARYGFGSARLFLGQGALGLEVAVAPSGSAPKRSDVLACWKTRKGGRAAPVLLVVLHPGGAALCGPAGETPPVHPEVDPGQVERLCRETLTQPDRLDAVLGHFRSWRTRR